MQQVFQLKIRIRSTLTAICMVMSKIPMITMIGSSRSMLMQFKYFSPSYLFVKEYHSLIRNRNCLPFACFVRLFLILCCVMFLCLFVFVLCLVFPWWPVCLDYTFLIAPSVFTNVCYLLSSRTNVAAKAQK